MNLYAKYIILCGALVGASALAEPTGKYETLLLQALMANANGECPSAIMADPLKQSCDSQIADVKDKLTKLGQITKLSYLGIRDTKAGKAEQYTVFFEHGEWDWALNTQSDGRLKFANAPNLPHYDVGSYSLSKN